MRYLLCCFMFLNCWSLTLTAVEQLSMAGRENSIDSGLAQVQTLSDTTWHLQQDLRSKKLHQRQAWIHLHQADRRTVAQCLAFSLDCWWLEVDDGILLSRDKQLPEAAADELLVRTYATPFKQRLDLAEQVENLLQPWLGGLSGIDYHPDLGRWSASLNKTGHERLRTILVQLERPRMSIPSFVPDPALPYPKQSLQAAVEGNDWHSFGQSLAAATGSSICFHPRLLSAKAKTITLPATLRMEELPQALAANGISAAWLGGALCCDIASAAVTQRHHPGQSTRLAVLQLPRFPDAVSRELYLTRLQQSGGQAKHWQQPGVGMLPLPGSDLVLIVAEEAVLRQLVIQIDQWQKQE